MAAETVDRDGSGVMLLAEVCHPANWRWQIWQLPGRSEGVPADYGSLSGLGFCYIYMKLKRRTQFLHSNSSSPLQRTHTQYEIHVMGHGGRTVAEFIREHFTKVETIANKSNRSRYRCNYCPEDSDLIEHRDNRLPKHLADVEKCPSAPRDARSEALQFMRSKIPALAAESDSSGVVSGGQESNTATTARKRKAKTTLDSYVDHALTTTQQSNANLKLLRYVSCNIGTQSP